MLQHFIALLAWTAGYQLVGVALFLPLDLALPKTDASLKQQGAGLSFLLAGALVATIVGVAVGLARDALHIAPVASFHTSAGGPVLAAVAFALWVDLQFYVLHRFEHRFLWRFHAVHHSIRHLSAANSYHHWTEALWLTLAALPLMVVDVEIGPTMALLALLFRFQQFYIHSSSRVHLGPLRWLLVDNRYHRIHHSIDQAHHDRNFGAMTPLWDWLFGTFHMPAPDEWPEVGLKGAAPPTNLWEWWRWPWRQATSRVGGVKGVPAG